MQKINYNDEPVFYCRRCLSLRILFLPHVEDSEYCDECTSTDIGQELIEQWEKRYKERFKHSFLNTY